MSTEADINRVGECKFPSTPGVYVVYEAAGADRPLYVGVARTQTIRQRWQGQHLRPRSGGSALRRSLGVYLGLASEKLRRPNRYYPDAVEGAITQSLQSCYVACFPTASAGDAAVLETAMIRGLDPMLNAQR